MAQCPPAACGTAIVVVVCALQPHHACGFWLVCLFVVVVVVLSPTPIVGIQGAMCYWLDRLRGPSLASVCDGFPSGDIATDYYYHVAY